MDISRFDLLARAVSTAETRRKILRLPLAMLALAGLSAAAGDGAAAGRRRRRRARRNRRRRDHTCARRSISSICAGTCGTIKNRKTCGRKVNCGRCAADLACPECAANEVCRNGACLPCSVVCTGNQTGAECGAALAEALGNVSLSTITICPGTYAGNFTINRSVTLVGAGQGSDPATSTVFNGDLGGRVLWLQEQAGTVVLEKIRITGGQLANDAGAGILNQGAGLTMTNCTITGNQGTNVSGVGIYSQASLQLIACEISNNSRSGDAEPLAGGIFVQADATLTNCQITGNITSGEGGGLLVAAGPTSLLGQTTVINNTATAAGGILVADGASLTVAPGCRVTNNTATELFGGIANEGSVTLQGSSPATIVVNNCPSNCQNVPGCTENQIHCSN